MIRGRFGPAARPFVEGIIRLPRLGASLIVPLLIDTGADTTSLSPRDWRAAGLRESDFSGPSVTITGYGGEVICPVERAELILQHENGARDRWAVDIEIAPATRASGLIPSILGRDILREYRLVCSPSEGVLTMDAP